MKHIRFRFLLASIALLAAACSSGGARKPSSQAGMGIKADRQRDGSFRVVASGSVYKLRFLSSQIFHLQSVPAKPSAKVPELMVVKSDASWKAVTIAETDNSGGVTFATTDLKMVIQLPEDNQAGISVTLKTPKGQLIGEWLLHPDKVQSLVSLQADEHLYGFGDRGSALDQRGNKVEINGQEAGGKNIPFYMSSAGYGLFFHNFYPSTFDLGATEKDWIELNGTDGDLDFYFLAGSSYKDLITKYNSLTGFPALLPRWFLGFHQSKASYQGRDAFTVGKTMRDKKLPVDSIFYDEWSDDTASKSFTTDLWKGFGLRLMISGNPFIVGSGALMDEMAKKRFLLEDANGKPVIESNEDITDSQGNSANLGYVDFFSPPAAKNFFSHAWAPALKNGAYLGMIAFDGMDSLKDPSSRRWPSLNMTVAKAGNLYSLAYAGAMLGQSQKTQAGGRPTGLVRVGFAGSQRYAWTTTSDSMPEFEDFHSQVRALMSLTMSGFSNIGYDIGGWDHKGPDDVYARWFAAGAFNPFMWAHGQEDHEPYSHGKVVEDAARFFLKWRYKLIPYLYSIHESASKSGIPMIRAFPLESPDPKGATIDDEFFLGDQILVAPLFNTEGSRDVYLPKGNWHDLFDEKDPQEGLQTLHISSTPINRIPAYVRSGSIIPMGPAMQYSDEKPVNPLSIHFYSYSESELKKGSRKAEFSLYEDDGQTLHYQNGENLRTKIVFEQSTAHIRFQASQESGNGKYLPYPSRGYWIQIHGLTNPIQSVIYSGDDLQKTDKDKLPKDQPSWGMDGRSLWIYLPAVQDSVVELNLDESETKSDAEEIN